MITMTRVPGDHLYCCRDKLIRSFQEPWEAGERALEDYVDKQRGLDPLVTSLPCEVPFPAPWWTELLDRSQAHSQTGFKSGWTSAPTSKCLQPSSRPGLGTGPALNTSHSSPGPSPVYTSTRHQLCPKLDSSSSDPRPITAAAQPKNAPTPA